MSNPHASDHPAQLSAWGDESMRFAASPKAYVLAAALIEGQLTDDVREVVRPLRVAGTKLHWRDLDRRQRDKVVDVVAGLEALHLVVIATPLDPRRQERARAKCIQRMLSHLGGLGVHQMVLEQRTESLNRLDQKLITKLRGTRAFPAFLTVDFRQPSKEPLLWLPDVVAGAVGEELADTTSPWARRLEPCIERLNVDLN